ncbi:MAG: alpha-amylase, partial [Proteobacteria bacterium]|nr:alpha-amylase [Pseudomonadota bacterium]
MRIMAKRSCVALAVLLGWVMSNALAAEIERVEPPFWWVGFENPQLQLLVYGEDVGAMSPTVDWPGVTGGEVTTTGNPNYLFVHLQIAAGAEAGQFDIVFS